MKKNKSTHRMSGLLIILFMVIFLIITGRFLYIQVFGVVSNVSLEEWAKEKRTSTHILPSERGKIIDSNGMILAHDRAKYKVYGVVAGNVDDPSDYAHIENIEEAAKQLAPLLETEEAYIYNKLKTGLEDKRFQVEFGEPGKNLSRETRDLILDLGISGLHFEEKSVRYYPNGELASHALGFARVELVEEDEAKAHEEIVGITGIEKEMNDYLRGEDGFVSYQRDSYNNKLLNPEEYVKESIDGKDIYLTIDQKIQILLEDVMTDINETYSPERLSALVMHAKTGEILAMSNRPGYDPNNPIDVENWYNDIVSTPFEPGSTVKMFTWAAAIDAGVYNGSETFQSGSYKINPRVQKINDHNQGRGWGEITYDEGFTRSSNVATSKLVWEKLGTEKYMEYLKAFDFDQETGVDLPGEVKGKILYNYPLEKITTGFGQGTTMTPIQQVKAATSITNEGKMLKPYVIKKIVDPNTGEVIEEKSPQVVGEPISKATADQVKDLLYTVVNSEDGTGTPYKLDDYSVIGKTGTSQIPRTDGVPGYMRGHGKNIFSFLGMAPKEDPELIMYVSVNQPELDASETGSTPIAHLFKSVMEHSLNYLNVVPDIDPEDTIVTVEIPKIINESVEAITKKLENQGLKVTIVGSGETISKASVEAGSVVLEQERIILITDNPLMPDITGWSLREVQKLVSLTGLKVDLNGTGYVVSQNIEIDTPLKKGDHLVVELEPPNE